MSKRLALFKNKFLRDSATLQAGALLNAAGIPAICYGPGDIALAHSATEWVAEEEIVRATSVLERLALDWCGTA